MQTLHSFGGGSMFRNLEAEQHRLNLTNAEVAQILNVSRPEIVTLLKRFDCKFEYLFDEETPPTPAA